ncbi:hypothetical protein D9757_003264 [Collybiopsis confluens]|uniref:Uncharacterized protein n=1 Tax=Collybiopsis confluens TaxID=2823264 RepID=A0A8H5HYU8_9AGAR|nr:hypothetical protein D9757_003264 [Collybiopsis confluens]
MRNSRTDMASRVAEPLSTRARNWPYPKPRTYSSSRSHVRPETGPSEHQIFPLPNVLAFSDTFSSYHITDHFGIGIELPSPSVSLLDEAIADLGSGIMDVEQVHVYGGRRAESKAVLATGAVFGEGGFSVIVGADLAGFGGEPASLGLDGESDVDLDEDSLDMAVDTAGPSSASFDMFVDYFAFVMCPGSWMDTSVDGARCRIRILIMSTATMTEIAVRDATHLVGSIDLTDIGEVEARKIMSYEHKALGYRPPPGSLASQAQAEAAKHPKGGPSPPDPTLLKKAALSDAAKIESERGHPIPKSTVVDGIDLTSISESEARKLMSEEHKALGYRPPPGSLAADAQAAASKHPEGKPEHKIDPLVLTEAAIKDAARISAERRSRSNSPPQLDTEKVTKEEQQKLQSIETKLLDSTAGTVAAEAQSAIDKAEPEQKN